MGSAQFVLSIKAREGDMNTHYVSTNLLWSSWDKRHNETPAIFTTKKAAESHRKKFLKQRKPLTYLDGYPVFIVEVIDGKEPVPPPYEPTASGRASYIFGNYCTALDRAGFFGKTVLLTLPFVPIFAGIILYQAATGGFKSSTTSDSAPSTLNAPDSQADDPVLSSALKKAQEGHATDMTPDEMDAFRRHGEHIDAEHADNIAKARAQFPARDVEIYNFMKDMWDQTDSLPGGYTPSRDDPPVLEAASQKFGITQKEARETYLKVDAAGMNLTPPTAAPPPSNVPTIPMKLKITSFGVDSSDHILVTVENDSSIPVEIPDAELKFFDRNGNPITIQDHDSALYGQPLLFNCNAPSGDVASIDAKSSVTFTNTLTTAHETFKNQLANVAKAEVNVYVSRDFFDSHHFSSPVPDDNQGVRHVLNLGSLPFKYDSATPGQ